MIIPRLIRKLFTVYHKCQIKNELYLTFDDGPNDNYTPRLLEVLAKYNVKATFFVNGNRLLEFPEIARMIVSDGHVLANHTLTHRVLPHSLKQENVFEIMECQKIIDSFQLNNKKLFRPPQGLIGIKSLAYLYLNKHKLILWTIDSRDSFEFDNSKIIHRLKTRVRGGAILLFHDDSNACISVLEVMIPYWKNKGFPFSLF